MDDRLALLRAVLDRPADTTPRLVFADWLDDNGASDADRARLELIRLWYSLKPNMRSTTRALAQWLGANWPRLWPRVAAAADQTDPGRVRAQGRVLGGRLGWRTPYRGSSSMAFKAHFDRGFAEVVQFEGHFGYEHFWHVFAGDEPVARFEPLSLPAYEGTAYDGVATVTSGDWGAEVFDRLTGPPRVTESGLREKRYRAADGYGPAIRAAREVAAVMTARAREANGLIAPA